MTKLTRGVVSDLWPLCVSGDASADTRRLVDEFLATDPAFEKTLREAANDPLSAMLPPSLSPDHQLKTFDRVKRRLWGYPRLLQLAIVFSCFAFGRIVSDTSWDVSPRNFVVTAAIAAVFWIAFLVTLFRGRRAFLVRLR
jgi:anti-sigma factor RsiW